MEHYEVFLIPLLMLLDYFLTVVGARMAATKYRQHFKFPDYELNPLFQKAIAQKKWFNPKHLSLVALFTLAWLVLRMLLPGPNPVFEGLLGYLTTVFATVIGTHLANILTFRRLLRHPEDLSGEVVMTQQYLLSTSRHRVLTVLVPFTMAACLAPSPFLIGGVAGLVMLMIVKSLWGRKRRKPSKAEERPASLPEVRS